MPYDKYTKIMRNIKKIHNSYEFIYNRQNSEKTAKVFWKFQVQALKTRVLRSRSRVSGLGSHLQGSGFRFPCPTYEIISSLISDPTFRLPRLRALVYLRDDSRSGVSGPTNRRGSRVPLFRYTRRWPCKYVFAKLQVKMERNFCQRFC